MSAVPGAAAGAPELTYAPERGQAPSAPVLTRPLAVPVRLVWLLARRGGGSSATLVLPVVAFGTVTTLLLTVLAGALSFRQWDDELAGMYQVLAGMALVLLVVPLLTLGGAAARLSARRRDDRLATVRLLGATPTTVAVMTVVEAAALALLGALAGVAGYLLLGPLVQQVPFRGAPIGSAYWLPPTVVVATVGAVPALAAVSAAVGLRRVVVSPLGVRARTDAPRVGVLRAVVGLAVVAAGYVALSSSYADVAVAAAVVLGVLAAGLAVLNLLGPWVIGALARVQHRRADDAARLLAARAVAESPKAVWRQVSGVAMTSFVAVVAGTGTAVMTGAEPVGGPERFLAQDVRTGILVTVVAGFLMVACSAGVNQAADVLDRAALYRNLDRIGMPVATMERARVRTVMGPLVAVAAISAGVGAVLVLPLVGLSLLVAPLSVAVVAACLLAGLALVRLGLLATRPVLRSVLATPA